MTEARTIWAGISKPVQGEQGVQMQRELVAWKEHLKRLTHNQMLSVELVPSTTSVHFFRDILDSNLTCSMVEAPRCSLKPSIETNAQDTRSPFCSISAAHIWSTVTCTSIRLEPCLACMS